MSNGAVLDSTLIGGDTAGASSKCLISDSVRFDYVYSPDGSVSRARFRSLALISLHFGSDHLKFQVDDSLPYITAMILIKEIIRWRWWRPFGL